MGGPLLGIAAGGIAPLLERPKHDTLGSVGRVLGVVDEARLDRAPFLQVALAGRLGQRPDLELLVLALDRRQPTFGIAPTRVRDSPVVLRPEAVTQVCPSARAHPPEGGDEHDGRDDGDHDHDPYPGLHVYLLADVVEVPVAARRETRFEAS